MQNLDTGELFVHSEEWPVIKSRQFHLAFVILLLLLPQSSEFSKRFFRLVKTDICQGRRGEKCTVCHKEKPPLVKSRVVGRSELLAISPRPLKPGKWDRISCLIKIGLQFQLEPDFLWIFMMTSTNFQTIVDHI